MTNRNLFDNIIGRGGIQFYRNNRGKTIWTKIQSYDNYIRCTTLFVGRMKTMFGTTHYHRHMMDLLEISINANHWHYLKSGDDKED